MLTRPTKEFLTEVTERARRYGWKGDYVEVAAFLAYLYEMAGVPCPTGADIEPFPEDTDRQACCQQPENLIVQPSPKPELVVRQCQVCGLRHFELTVDPGRFAVEMK